MSRVPATLKSKHLVALFVEAQSAVTSVADLLNACPRQIVGALDIGGEPAELVERLVERCLDAPIRICPCSYFRI